ncbi:hypothetical protein [Calycomorphotria hydatis]|uniref:Uncharacterized protein n=1 Tax=Calycomorphotria hydatis TaxID=2528027 RepID=A0A517T6R7_9PLAN|nr:hypothetical protein [Calycomorphotria hydatis]QDT64071.1 hypothetical protein V22_13020 [Calycomorphotria hydatis]
MESSPLGGVAPDLLAKYGADSNMGRLLRQGEAKRLLKSMEEAEPDVRQQEALRLQIMDRIEQINAEHALNIKYLIEFGVSAAERHQFQAVLAEVIQHGGLTLQEAADLAHAQLLSLSDQSVNGPGSSDWTPSSSSPASGGGTIVA